ncbi:MAG: hypothetical protein ACI4F1_11025 [Bariatricus sp.]
MKKLQTDYLDLVLLHQPYGDTYGFDQCLTQLFSVKEYNVYNTYKYCGQIII